MEYTHQHLVTQKYTYRTENGTSRTQRGMSKSIILAIAEKYRPEPVLKVKAYFDDYNNANPGRNLRFLLLPIATPQLNPIELIWSYIKAEARKQNHDYSTTTLKTILENIVSGMKEKLFENNFNHSRKFLEAQWKLDEQLLVNPAEGNFTVFQNMQEEDEENEADN